MLLNHKQLKTIREYTAAKAVYEMAVTMLENGLPMEVVIRATDKAFYAMDFKHNPLLNPSGVKYVAD